MIIPQYMGKIKKCSKTTNQIQMIPSGVFPYGHWSLPRNTPLRLVEVRRKWWRKSLDGADGEQYKR